jgi:hypothetical protein
MSGGSLRRCQIIIENWSLLPLKLLMMTHYWRPQSWLYMKRNLTSMNLHGHSPRARGHWGPQSELCCVSNARYATCIRNRQKFQHSREKSTVENFIQFIIGCNYTKIWRPNHWKSRNGEMHFFFFISTQKFEDQIIGRVEMEKCFLFLFSLVVAVVFWSETMTI